MSISAICVYETLQPSRSMIRIRSVFPVRHLTAKANMMCFGPVLHQTAVFGILILIFKLGTTRAVVGLLPLPFSWYSDSTDLL